MVIKLFVNSKKYKTFNNTSKLHKSLKQFTNERLTVTINDGDKLNYYECVNQILQPKNDIGWRE